MEMILYIVLIAAVLVGAGAYWQAWQIMKRSKKFEALSESEAADLERRLNVSQICSYIAVGAMLCRIFLPMFVS